MNPDYKIKARFFNRQMIFKFFLKIYLKKKGSQLSWLEHILDTGNVAGSNPAWPSSTFFGIL